jgi:L-lactate dehydrogenase complex protein LldF
MLAGQAAQPSQASGAVDFNAACQTATNNRRLMLAVRNAVERNDLGRRARWGELPDIERLRDLAAAIKQHTLDHLDHYLQKLADSVERNGGRLHCAADAEEARQIILKIARDAGVTRCIKSKSMVSEEIHLTQAMERAGLDVVETDLGEFIVQLDRDAPSHIVMPIIHKDRGSIADLFSRHFKTARSDDPQQLTMQARAHLREKFRRAEMGMTGGNFVVAESGQVCVVENEGNARQSITSPRVLVSLVGIEKIVPRLSDLSVLLKLLARSATGQPMTVYTSLFGGPRRTGEKSGPEQFHLVLIDNGRSGILANPEYREILRCIRCGACLNICPIYRNIGGHSYNSVYPGPIGALITPLLRGLEPHKHLPQASSLCGACYEACPVKIDIPRHLVHLRRDIHQRQISSPWERMVLKLWARVLRSPRMYRCMSRVQGWRLRRLARKNEGWITDVPRPMRAWTDVRDLPAPALRSFHQLWRDRQG